jgi:conjugative relaxase-like TrwC/TraI family protein
MLTISKPLSAGQAQHYHRTEFANARENYYTQSATIIGTWHGRLAAGWGLTGDVQEAHFQRLADGQHPVTGQQLVRHQTPRSTANEKGEKQTTMEHRAGWDATFSAPKSVSVTALVGGDVRVREAHEASVNTALDELERYVEARLGGNHAPETTGNFVAVKFGHDSSRPVDGYAAPQVHTHVVVFNMTRTAGGDIRPLQPRELYRSQQFATAVYRSELARRLAPLGYRVGRGENGQPEITGYSQDYLHASSPRRQQIEAELARQHRTGAAAAQIAAHKTRQAKVELSSDAVQRAHLTLAAKFGHQPEQIIRLAHSHGAGGVAQEPHTTARQAVTFAKDRNIERVAVIDERALLRDALSRAMGDCTVHEIKAELEHRAAHREFIQVEPQTATPARQFTTPEMTALERQNIERMRRGRGTASPLAAPDIRRDVENHYQHLSAHQRTAVAHILANTDQVQALEGVAGSGKTTVLGAVRDAAAREGYQVEGMAPTSRAAQKLGESGIPTTTLQQHLVQERPTPDGRRLYVLDESSLASTVQMHQFLHRLPPKDRVLLVGDVRQHEAVDAGRPYHQLQEAGVTVTSLDHIVRQQDPQLKAVVEQLSRGEIPRALKHLEDQGRVHEIHDHTSRYHAIADVYVSHPTGTLVVSPDNQSRRDINDVIHAAMQRTGQVAHEEHPIRVLVARQELTGADRQWADRYAIGDLVRYSKGSALGVAAGEYARVTDVRPDENLVRVRQESGATLTYDPKRLHGVTLYRETARAFAVGDRVQFTAPDRARGVANRELGTIRAVQSSGQLELAMDSGRGITLPPGTPRHLDYGYAVTSHSSQGQTTDRVLVHVDTDRLGATMVNRRLAYVAVSRGRYDAQIYTNDQAQLATALSRDASQQSALGPQQATRRTVEYTR